MSKIVWKVLERLEQNELSESDFGLLVLNQPILCDLSLIKFLWTKACIRSLADGGSNRWLNFLEKESAWDLELPDFISGDFDSITPKTRKYFEYRNVKFIPTPDQDETDFTKALKCMAERLKTLKSKVNHVFVLCETGGRFDHIMANINTLHRCSEFLPPEVSVAILSSQNVTWVLPPGTHQIVTSENFVEKKYCCGLIPVCGSTVITTSGLKWNLNDQVTEFRKLVSTSNTYSDKTVEITCNGYVVWTTEYCSRFGMASMFRTEEMVLCQLFIQPEAAYASVSILGEMGIVQFRDLNAHVKAFQRKFVGEVRRCDEMERKLRYFEVEVNKDGVKVPEIEEIPVAPNPREMTDLEGKLEKTENEIRELSKNAVNLHINYYELTELKHVLEKTQVFFIEPVMQPEDSSEPLTKFLINEENALPQAHRGRLGFVAGVIPRERVPAFERMLWRISRGNVFLRQTPIESPLEDPTTRNKVYKTVFVAFFQGEALKSRVLKVCTGFHANIYPCPNSNAERREMLDEVKTRLEDLNLVLNRTHDHRERVLVSLARELQNWTIKVRKMKAIYHTLNMFNMDVTKKCLIGECWIPAADLTNVHNALADGGRAVGSSIQSFLNVIETLENPPTFNRTNKYTRAFQNIIDAYGVSSYGEINPALYTIVTFPFLFAVMFGDSGHGLILALFSGFLIYNEKKYAKTKIKNEVASIFFGGRYIIFLMGLFSIYTGLIYNDIFSKSTNVFGSSWSVDHIDNKTLKESKFVILDPALDYRDSPYPMGLDPVWQVANANKIVFLNSFKLKLSIILGVLHMMFGVCLNVFNHVHFGNYSNIFLEFIPQIVFLCVFFFYLVSLIVMKWIMYSARNSGSRGSSCAPSILILFINMVLMQQGKANNDCENFMFSGQYELQMAFLAVSLVCVPVLLLGKPLYRLCKSRSRTRKPVSKREDAEQSFELQRSDFQFESLTKSDTNSPQSGNQDVENLGEVMIYQAIHTIEYVLSTVSHTASYLRLWALSLAHSQLSDVLWSKILHEGLVYETYVGAPVLFVIFAAWAFLTLSILVMMEGLSAFLHTLRLHWVEFMSKFFKGEGYAFAPFSFKNILDQETEED